MSTITNGGWEELGGPTLLISKWFDFVGFFCFSTSTIFVKVLVGGSYSPQGGIGISPPQAFPCRPEAGGSVQVRPGDTARVVPGFLAVSRSKRAAPCRSSHGAVPEPLKP